MPRALAGDGPSADRRPQGLAVEQFRDQVRAAVRHPGDSLSMIQTNPNTVFQRTAVRRARERERF
jgi:hypothetical protein